MAQKFFRFLPFLLLLGGVVSVWAFTGEAALVQQNTAPITIEEITGTYGGETGGDDTNAGDLVVSGDYGYHCTGSCNNGEKSQSDPAIDNLLRFRVKKESNNPGGSYVVQALATLKSKGAGQNTQDGAGWPGPPKWNATCTVSLSSPVHGTGGNPGNSGAGSISHNYSHSSPSTIAHWPDEQNPDPKWDETSSGWMEFDAWDIDEQDPSTHTFWVSATARTSFQATANEIQVNESWLRATAELKATVTQQ